MIARRLARPLASSRGNAWTCPACSRASLQSRLPQLSQLPQQRSIHRVPPLRYDETFTKDGVPGFLSPNGFRIAWTSYQDMMIRKLNELTAGEVYENVEPKKLVLQFARDPMNASLFNHASMAHNNHFFFSTLSTSAAPLNDTPRLRDSLINTYGSIDTLRATMLDTAMAMFGPGFVWLVWANHAPSVASNLPRGDWRILTTYLAGTPYPEAGYRQQGLDMNTSDAATAAEYAAKRPANTAGAFGAHSQNGQHYAKLPPGATQVMPVLCVNTWEHAYIYDFGLPGKGKYLSDWWDAVDWSAVQSNCPGKIFEQPRFLGRN